MSNLSDFLRRPYPGLSFDSTSFISTKDLDVRGTTGGGSPATLDPTLILRNQDNNLVGNGADIRFYSRDSASAEVKIGYVLSKTTSVTAGVVSSNLDLMALSGGAERIVRYVGADSALVPAVTGQSSLGSATLGWLAVRVSNVGGSLKGALEVDATGAKLSSSGSYPLQLGANAGIHQRFDSDGRISINANAAVPNDAQVRIGGTGYHQGAGVGYGLKVDVGPPAGSAGPGGQYYAAQIVPTNAVSPEFLTGLWVSGTTGSAPQNYTGIHVGAGTGTVSNVGLVIQVTNALATNRAINSTGNAPSSFAGPVSIFSNGTNATGFEVSRSSGGASALGLVYLRDNTGLFTGSYIEARTDGSTGFNLLNFHNGAGTTYAKMRADGVTTLGTASITNTSLLSVNGRVHVTANQTFDLFGNTVADTVAITGSVTVGNGQTFGGYVTRVTAALSGTANAYGTRSELTLSSATANTTAAALRYVMDAGGTAGTAYGQYTAVATAGGHSGTLYGSQFEVAGQATTAAIYALDMYFSGASVASSYGLRLRGTPGNALLSGVEIDSSLNTTGAAFLYRQRTASTGKFLHFIDSGAADRFVVDSNGDMKIGGTTRRIMADLSDSTHANRLAFQSSTVNSTSILNIIPNGSGTFAGFAAYSTSTHASAIRSMVFATTTAAGLRIEAIGVSEVPAQIQVGGSATVTCNAYNNGDFAVGKGFGALTDTAGFCYIPSEAGTHTGVPTARTGFTPILIDTTLHKIGIYSGGAWKWTAALT